MSMETARKIQRLQERVCEIETDAAAIRLEIEAVCRWLGQPAAEAKQPPDPLCPARLVVKNLWPYDPISGKLRGHSLEVRCGRWEGHAESGWHYTGSTEPGPPKPYIGWHDLKNGTTEIDASMLEGQGDE